ncbi:MAG: 3-oxoacyl-ACP reductase FabG [Acidobacteria bacterium]|nr:3-oxoacyl-ACP reductase FabG [Acidobacteriota bacterium]NIM62148.1 3-oxoacyl-ACP reductase FabG [Acidobacteriota bacterium]NIO59802.1 3-oxoacyl-ACP reductase FabG [Acidobacteriota bacterium]NIQ30885.1 3-oxoacyl-ACP reductase FabG [Acidobacteriota bacterium]NIQ85958.1 3-oxoacyl-ACP reductase FabG [Acidobacteriota bacterium]
MSEDLNGKVALVTGGSRGIGEGIARHLSTLGAHVALTARTMEAAESVAASIREDGGAATAVTLDVSDPASVESCVATVLEDHERIDILVNNAGITRDNLLLRMKPDDWEAVISTNLDGTYRMCRAVVPKMVRAKAGRIVNITSVVGTLGNPGQANYAATKAGIEAFSRSLARELGSRNITVNCVAPGFIDTDMTRALDAKQRDALLSQVPLGRLGSPQDVADAVAFLVGSGATYVTGITLHVNGGMHM